MAKNTPGLLDEHQTSDELNVPVATLRRWRWAGRGPKFLKLGGLVRYDPDDLQSYIDASRRRSTTEPAGAAA